LLQNVWTQNQISIFFHFEFGRKFYRKAELPLRTSVVKKQTTRGKVSSQVDHFCKLAKNGIERRFAKKNIE
jgi:hypothetical protein